MYVKEQLVNQYGEKQVEEGGMKVHTTLDWDKQQAAEEAVKKGVAANVAKYKATNAALVAIDPKTGQILAMVGSRDYFDKTIDGNVNVAIRPASRDRLSSRMSTRQLSKKAIRLTPFFSTRKQTSEQRTNPMFPKTMTENSAVR